VSHTSLWEKIEFPVISFEKEEFHVLEKWIFHYFELNFGGYWKFTLNCLESFSFLTILKMYQFKSFKILQLQKTLSKVCQNTLKNVLVIFFLTLMVGVLSIYAFLINNNNSLFGPKRFKCIINTSLWVLSSKKNWSQYFQIDATLRFFNCNKKCAKGHHQSISTQCYLTLDQIIPMRWYHFPPKTSGRKSRVMPCMDMLPERTNSKPPSRSVEKSRSLTSAWWIF